MLHYIIVGQGICGTFLSYYLQQAGKDVMVIDNAQNNTASKVASGIINPVTGRRIVKTWLIDELLPFALQAYTSLEKVLNASLIQPCNVLDFFATLQMKDAFESRIDEEPELLRTLKETDEQKDFFRFNYGIGEINSGYLTNVQTLLLLWREKLKKQNALLEETFDWNDFAIEEKGIVYKKFKAEKIIFCSGVADAENPYFSKLPFAFNKGEALIAHIPNLPQSYIYKQGINIVPWKEKDLFWIGSNYVWNYTDLLPSEAFKKRTQEQLKYWLKLPFTIVDHIASERPANVERRPFVGLHPVHPTVGILNGMGTKGCSLAPYFAHQLAQHLVYQTPIEPLADIKRFTRVLSR